MHLNINCLNKIDEMCYNASSSNATVIGITDAKLDYTVYDSKAAIDNYSIV